MWWTEEEELLQVQADAAGAAFPDLLGLLDSDEEEDPDPEDIVEDDLSPVFRGQA
jgi:hypothetical protein